MPALQSVTITPAESPHAARAWVFRSLLVLYLGYSMYRAWRARTAPYVPVDWGFQSSAEVIAWLRGLLRREIDIYFLAFVLGLLTPPAWWHPPAGTSRLSQALTWSGWLLFGVVAITGCSALAWDERPPAGWLLIPLGCFLAGARLSSAALRGARSFALAVGQLALLLLMLVGTGVFAARLALATAPLPLEVDLTSIPSKLELADRIRATRSPDVKPRPLRLTDAELAALVNSALGRGGSPSRARVHFEPRAFAMQMSIALPGTGTTGRFLNVQLAGRLEIEQGHLHLDFEQLRVGRLDVPTLVLGMLASTLHATLLDDPQVRRIIEAIDGLTMEPGAVTFAFQPGAISRQIVPSLVQLLWERPDVSAETGIYLRHLIAMYDRLPADDNRFGSLTQAAFALAQQRSAEHDPRLENRAAIFALAILLGHPDLEPFVGEVFDPALRAQANRLVGTVRLRGREDWTRHFWVSAGLILLSNEATSDRIGRLKEQLDSNAGGTGFSFADMLANFAGNRLAIAAIRDQATARAVQAQLAAGFEVDTVFPPADGLPENIPAEELQSRYGGVGGAEYNAILDEINRRLSKLPAIKKQP
ncbi:MAG: hypothetical protein K2Y37_15715 [Pirellulales bacterium]|nr:hypothetical protein [Pirellulales bacterium]